MYTAICCHCEGPRRCHKPRFEVWGTLRADVAKRAPRQASFLIRAFIINNRVLYVKTFNVLVKPILMYASCVWFPQSQRGKSLLTRIVRRFRRAVALKCQAGAERVPARAIDIIDDFQNAGIRIFKSPVKKRSSPKCSI